MKETLINSSTRWPVLFVTDCVNVPRRSYGCAFGSFSCQAQKALGHRTNSFNQRLLRSAIIASALRTFPFRYFGIKGG